MTIINDYVLLIDAHNADAAATVQTLIDAGFGLPIMRLADGASAIDFLSGRRTDTQRDWGQPILIIMEFSQSAAGDTALLASVRRNSVLRGIPVIVLTDSQDRSDAINCFSLGADAYMVKPLKVERFLEAMRETDLRWVLTRQNSISGNPGA